jgi:3-phenylpropionate/trans-cinnamate dioxygenase ferredoxin subunit
VSGGAATRSRRRYAFPRAGLDRDGRMIVTVGRREIAILAHGDELFAIFNRCPHQQGPLGEGGVWGAANAAAVAGRCYDAHACVLRCRWHRFEFDLRTGRCLADPERLRVGVYEVHAKGDEVAVYL